jgi:6-pyruvoyl-tetrahydropterin synthase
VLQTALANALRELDGQSLNDLAELRDPNPTAEVVARHVWRRIAASLGGQPLARLDVRVWESSEAYAGYAGELP